jgi:hypothetical protein
MDLFVPPIAQRTPRPIERPGVVCAASSEESGDVIVAVNTWGPQVALLERRSLDPVLSARIPFEWARSREHSQRPGYWGPTWPLPRAACGEEYAIIGYRRQRYVTDGVWDVLAGGMVVVNLNEGTMTVLGGEEPPKPGSVTFLTPGAASGDRFFFYTNSHFDYPVVREYRLVTNGD